MTTMTILKDTNFREVAETKADSKNRIGLGRLGSHKVRLYRVYKNEAGQFILDPLETVSAHEAWLFRNKKAKTSVLNGLEDARQGRLTKRRENFSKFLD